MESQWKQNQSFTILADVEGNGYHATLHVLPGHDQYLIVLDGDELGTLAFDHDGDTGWKQLTGQLSDPAVEAIGKAIVAHHAFK